MNDVPILDRCEFVGGPYDGFVWFPHHGGAVTSKWYLERSQFHGVPSAGHPTSAEFHEIDLLWVDGPQGEAYYMQRDDVHWRAVDMEAMMS